MDTVIYARDARTLPSVYLRLLFTLSTVTVVGASVVISIKLSVATKPL